MIKLLPAPVIRLRNQLHRSRLWRPFVVMLVLGLATLIALGGGILIGVTGAGDWVVLGTLAILIGGLIFTRPPIGLYVLIVFVFLNLSDALGVAFQLPSLTQPLVVLIFVSVIGNRVMNRKPIVFRGVEIAILAYGLAALVSSFGARSQAESLNQLVDWIKDFAILLVVVQLCDEEQVWKRAQWALILSAAFLALLSTYQMVTNDFSNDFYGLAKAPVHEITSGFDSTRVTGPLDDPNYYAQILLMALPLAVYRVMTEQDLRLRLLGGGCAALLILTAVFTYSRGAFVALPVLGLLIVRERKMNPYKVLGGLVLILAFVVPLLPPGYVERIMTLTNVLPADLSMQTENSFRGRSSEMIVSTQMFLEHPISGIGFGNFGLLYLEYSSRLGLDDRLQDREAHSLYLEVAAEQGIIGILAFVGMLYMLFRSLRQARRQLAAIGREDLIPWAVAAQYGLVSYLITSIFLHDSYSRYLWLSVSLVAATSVLAEKLAGQYERAQKDRNENQDILFIYESVQLEG